MTSVISAKSTSNERLPFILELARTYVGIDPVTQPIPVRPVLHYMMGGVHTDNYGLTPMEGLYSAGENACVTINGANRLGSNSLTECLVFGARAGAAAASYALETAHSDADLSPAAERDEQRIRDHFLSGKRGSEKVANLRRELQDSMERGAEVFRTKEGLQQSMSEIADLRERIQNLDVQDTTGVYNVELIGAIELDSCWTWPRPSCTPPTPGRSPVALTSAATTLTETTKSGSSTSLPVTPRTAPSWRTSPSPLPTGNRRSASTKIQLITREHTMAQRQLTVNVERYHPEQGAAAYVDSYQVPARDGMMVLDALNYIRDDLDPTLAFRWSCRMGICGSCGMTVDDRPRLTCEDNLASYGDEITVAPLDGFPVIRDLVVDIDDFMQNKLPSVKPWLIRKDTKPWLTASTFRRPGRWLPMPTTPPASTACSAMPPAPSLTWSPTSPAPPPSPSPSATTSTLETRAQPNVTPSLPSRKASGTAPSSENAPSPAPRESFPPRPYSAPSRKAPRAGPSPSSCPGARDERRFPGPVQAAHDPHLVAA